MHFSAALTVLGAIASSANAAATPKIPTNFFLVTTSQSTSSANSSLLANVSATSFFDPGYQANYFLRTQTPGYNSLPRFNLTKGTVSSLSYGTHGVGSYVYNSSRPVAGTELQFAPAAAPPRGTIGLRDGYLVTVAGAAKGWTICDGEFYERVVFWRGTDASCTETYIQAVSTAPY